MVRGKIDRDKILRLLESGELNPAMITTDEEKEVVLDWLMERYSDANRADPTSLNMCLIREFADQTKEMNWTKELIDVVSSG